MLQAFTLILFSTCAFAQGLIINLHDDVVNVNEDQTFSDLVLGNSGDLHIHAPATLTIGTSVMLRLN